MKYLIILFFPLFAFAQQQTIIDSLEHDGIMRDYILFLPESFTGEEAFPLILNFHGLGSNATQQMLYSNLFALANEHQFVIVHPNGTLNEQGVAFWNVGFGGGETVDDVGFVHELLDHLLAAYNLDDSRVYSTGMSNGGFFSYTLACEMSDRIAAIASVTGAMTVGNTASCSPSNAVPVMEIHGTNDATVPFEGNTLLGLASIDDAIDFWVEQNNCESAAEFTLLDDIDPNDESTVEHYVYSDGNQGVTVELYKVLNGGHTWPGQTLVLVQ